MKRDCTRESGNASAIKNYIDSYIVITPLAPVLPLSSLCSTSPASSVAFSSPLSSPPSALLVKRKRIQMTVRGPPHFSFPKFRCAARNQEDIVSEGTRRTFVSSLLRVSSVDSPGTLAADFPRGLYSPSLWEKRRNKDRRKSRRVEWRKLGLGEPATKRRSIKRLQRFAGKLRARTVTFQAQFLRSAFIDQGVA